MTKYRKRPVVIEAMQWDGTAHGSGPIISWAMESDGLINYRCGSDDGCDGMEGTHNLAIDTLEGRMLASAGDYIIRGVQGEFYPCKPEIFEATYEQVI